MLWTGSRTPRRARCTFRAMADNGDEPDEQEGQYWYCRHCGSSGHAESPPVNCPNCGKPN